MAARKPLVLTAGQVRQIPAGDFLDTLASASMLVTADERGQGAYITGVPLLTTAHAGKRVTYDQRRIDYFTGGGYDLTTLLDSAATLGSGWWCYIAVDGGYDLVVNTNGTDKMDQTYLSGDGIGTALTWTGGYTTGRIRSGMLVLLVCDGTRFFSHKVSPTITEVLTSGTSWQTPLGVRLIDHEMVGGGGSGGKNSGSSALAQPGRAGAYFRNTVTGLPGKSVTYAVGAAGAAQTTAGSAGLAGGDTVFDGNTAGGGTGGLAASVTANSTYPGAPAPPSYMGGVRVAGGSGYSIATTSGNFAGKSVLGEGAIRPATSNTGLVESTGYGAGGVGGISTAGVNGTAGSPGVIILRY